MSAAERLGMRQRWELPLLLCSAEAAHGEGVHPLDRIRIQKAIFLLTCRGALRWRTLYSYEPYDWGPYSRELAADLRNLRANGLIRVAQGVGDRHGRHALTEQGEELATVLWGRLDESELEFIRRIRQYVTSKDFNSLLREVYAEYPEYATESRWSGR